MVVIYFVGSPSDNYFRTSVIYVVSPLLLFLFLLPEILFPFLCTHTLHWVQSMQLFPSPFLYVKHSFCQERRKANEKAQEQCQGINFHGTILDDRI